MKKKVILSVLVCVFVAVLIWNLAAPAKFNGKALSFADSWRIRTFLTVKDTDFIEYGCGYSEDYAVKIGGLTYCLGQDDCGTVYIPELNFYYGIFLENWDALQQLLAKYS